MSLVSIKPDVKLENLLHSSFVEAIFLHNRVKEKKISAKEYCQSWNELVERVKEDVKNEIS